MKLLPVILLVVVCQAYTPITEQSWVKFRKVKDPTYETIPLHREPDIIHATHILIEERISTLSTLVRKSVRDFQSQMKKYATDITEHVKRATKSTADYGLVRKPELQHQYGMLFNHHGQVISGLKNMDLFLSIDLPKVEVRTSHMFHLHSRNVITGPPHIKKSEPTCVLLFLGIWKEQSWTHDRT